MINRGPRPSDTYATIHAEALADGTLSFKARGILAYLLSTPPGSTTTPEKLAKAGTDGERAVKSGIKELQDAGYLTRDEFGNLQVTDVPGIIEPVQDALPEPVERVGPPTPLQPVAPHGWQPSAAALKTAHDSIELMDITLSIVHYRIRAKELNREPTSGEWLRWLVEDEKKARAEERRLARENGDKKPWYATA